MRHERRKEEAQGEDALSQRGRDDGHDTASQRESVTRGTFLQLSCSLHACILVRFSLQKKMTTLIRSIIEEKDACVELRVQLAVHQLMAKT